VQPLGNNDRKNCRIKDQKERHILPKTKSYIDKYGRTQCGLLYLSQENTVPKGAFNIQKHVICKVACSSCHSLPTQ
jgi:hypothetical protein